eukprot:1140339-Pelagomonas_calceolata.AAC.3
MSLCVCHSIAASKVIATIGPSCQGVDELYKMLLAGAGGFRVDLTWGPWDYHKRSLKNLECSAWCWLGVCCLVGIGEGCIEVPAYNWLGWQEQWGQPGRRRDPNLKGMQRDKEQDTTLASCLIFLVLSSALVCTAPIPMKAWSLRSYVPARKCLSSEVKPVIKWIHVVQIWASCMPLTFTQA